MQPYPLPNSVLVMDNARHCAAIGNDINPVFVKGAVYTFSCALAMQCPSLFAMSVTSLEMTRIGSLLLTRSSHFRLIPSSSPVGV